MLRLIGPERMESVTNRTRKYLVYPLLLVLSLVSIWAFLPLVNVDIWGHVSSAPFPQLLGVGFVLYVSFLLIQVARWKYLLASVGVSIPWGLALKVFCLGWFVNTAIPFRAGEVARILSLDRARVSGTGKVAASIVAERLLDLAAIATIILGLVLVQFFVLPSSIILVVVSGWGIGFARLRLSKGRPGRLLRGVKNLATDFGKAWKALARSPTRLVTVFAISVFGWFVHALSLYSFVAAYSPGFSIVTAMLAGTIAMLVLIVPITPGAVGTLELAWVATFANFGYEPAEVLSPVLVYHTGIIAIVLLLGIWSMWSLGLTFGRFLPPLDAEKT